MELLIMDLDNNRGDPCCEKEKQVTKWAEAGIILNNEIFGNYVVASRLIEAGELLLEEFPLSVATYGRSDLLPFCLACGKDLALSERCGKCRWPICGNNGTCQNDPLHAEAECPIFVANNLRPKNLTMSEYGAIEVLRGLLLRLKNPAGWDRIQNFESHSTSRKESTVASIDTEFIIDFVQKKCKLVNFDRETMDKVIGVYCVNTFWAQRDTGRNISLLFDKVTLLAHDCDPNTRRDIVEKEVIMAGTIKKSMCIQIVADRIINPGEIITTYYTTLQDDVQKRQKYLREAFYFTCNCKRCVRELKETLDINGNNQY